MKNVLIASFDMEVGGVERSLVSLLNNFDYKNHQVDLMLYSHTGDFMSLLPKYPNLLKELKAYKTFRMTIPETIKSGKLLIGLARLRAKYDASKSNGEAGYKQMQYMWKYSLPFLPKIEKKYDIAISYLWPHYFVAEKVQARKKIAWIHTDFSTVDTDRKMDLQIWEKFDYIISVSEECRNAFIKKYPVLENKVLVMENITSPDLVRSLADEKVNNPMLQDSRFKLITVARLSHAKGIDNAVRALKLLKDKGYHNIVWYVVGYGGDEELIRTLIKENDVSDSFILLGKKLNPYPYMKAADLYVQPSRYEGKAVTVGEAQILGKPVLITNYPTAKSQIKDGLDGIICNVSVEGLATGIERLYCDNTLRSLLIINIKYENYSNSQELDKLYEMIGS
ncbi:glycosyltransferase [Peribacillus psychrosaccharolyticus]|uniref:Glycosyltransferase n=1 Tax=Peribacillus psychrosaccharolyticus TaxID=1407 RepID=A0A974S0R1_PERPY|nr:glycosyltransferase [Peribacillus psychrosaccharolyticus]MEC2056057.1 glycosyltransferase [Peribacillus psychrosaccharolyticus]MED3745498.1 glycosyltransferase [Peribacillus psychrosaccharolyticus]QQT00746.1 glycosyltransferase [Peribacillus psychrosaccharolyticus]